MNKRENTEASILLMGNTRLSRSIAVCLLRAGHYVTLCTYQSKAAEDQIDRHFKDLRKRGLEFDFVNKLRITSQIEDGLDAGLFIMATREEVALKKKLIRQIEQQISSDAIIAVNTESIPLHILQKNCNHPERIIGANWTEPAHTTLFLELIANEQVMEEHVDDLVLLAKDRWQKDPYVIFGELGVRSKMLAAMAREAFYLVENDYASVKDIDRAFRNDAGYYLPFVGIFRYIDLTGASVYGKVMKDLNPELSKSKILPEFFQKLVDRGDIGMRNDKGFYIYDEEVKNKIENRFQVFSYAIREITCRRPAEFMKQETTVLDKKK